MRIGVVGGAGGMGRVTAADLARSQGVEEVRIVDRDDERARELAGALGEPVRAVAASERFAETLEGLDAVVNAASHRLNVEIMEACLEVGAHYTDLGGLFHWALRQYELDDRFRQAGLAAAISTGSAPGLTNMLAAACCERLETLESIEIADAFVPGRDADADDAYVPPYAASTIIDEFTEPAMVFIEGELREVPAGSGGRIYEFPEGSVECVYTIHSEPATLPRSYADKGIRRVEWRLGLPPSSSGRRAPSLRRKTRTESSGSASSSRVLGEARRSRSWPSFVSSRVVGRREEAQPSPACRRPSPRSCSAAASACETEWEGLRRCCPSRRSSGSSLAVV